MGRSIYLYSALFDGDSVPDDLRSCYFLLGTCALIKKNTLSIFMLSGSIQFSLYFSLNQIMQFHKTMLSYFLKRLMQCTIHT